MKNNIDPFKILLVVAAVIGAGWFIYIQNFPAEETEADVRRSMARQEKELNDYCNSHAQSMLLNKITNDVVGLSKIINYKVPQFYYQSDNDADVTVEFINKSGGIERTNLRYVFEKSWHQKPELSCYSAPLLTEAERAARFRSNLERATAIK